MIERRKENISMEVALGKLQGQLEGILSSQARVERSLEAHIVREEEVFRTLHSRIDALHMQEKQEPPGEIVKLPWKALAFLMAAASAGGAGVKHILEILF